jgi:hypothetical protein
MDPARTKSHLPSIGVSLPILTTQTQQNQSGNLNRCIEPVLEHFVYVPKKCTANPQDIPFFLSTRLAAGDASKVADASGGSDVKSNDADQAATIEDPVKALREFESTAAEVAADFESKMIRF